MSSMYNELKIEISNADAIDRSVTVKQIYKYMNKLGIAASRILWLPDGLGNKINFYFKSNERDNNYVDLDGYFGDDSYDVAMLVADINQLLKNNKITVYYNSGSVSGEDSYYTYFGDINSDEVICTYCDDGYMLEGRLLGSVTTGGKSRRPGSHNKQSDRFSNIERAGLVPAFFFASSGGVSKWLCHQKCLF